MNGFHRQGKAITGSIRGVSILVLAVSLYGCTEKTDSTSGPEPKTRANAAEMEQSSARSEEGETAPTPAVEKAITDSIGLRLVRIPAGEFMMGSQESAEEVAAAFHCGDKNSIWFEDEHPQHRVRITKPFFLGIYAVTVGQFRQFVRDTNYKTEAEKDIPRSEAGGGGYSELPNRTVLRGPTVTWQAPGFPQTDEHPVVEVSWNDAVAFCNWLSKKEGKRYRLPTEAQWEYACRAGTHTRYYHGDDPEKLADVGNVADGTLHEKWPSWRPFFTSDEPISAKDGYVLTAQVGQFKPNAWGLYDMHGNVWQWCADWYGIPYANASSDSAGPSSGYLCVARGGSYYSTAAFARSATRGHFGRYTASAEIGFRVVREP